MDATASCARARRGHRDDLASSFPACRGYGAGAARYFDGKFPQFRRLGNRRRRRHRAGGADEIFAKHSARPQRNRSEEHTSELQSRGHLVCRLLLEKKKREKKDANTADDVSDIIEA